MPPDKEGLVARIRQALAARTLLGDPLPPDAGAGALKTWLGHRAGPIADLGVWQRLRARNGPRGDDSAVARKLELANQWRLAGDAQGAHGYIHDALDAAIEAGSLGGCICGLV